MTTPLLIDTSGVSQANRWAGQRRRPDYLDPRGGVINACADVAGPDESITRPDLLVAERRPHSLAVGSHQVLILSLLSVARVHEPMEPWLTLPGHSRLGLIQCLCLIQCHFLDFISPRAATALLLLPPPNILKSSSSSSQMMSPTRTRRN